VHNVRKITARVLAVLAVVTLALGLSTSTAQAQPILEIGPVSTCKLVTFFDFVLFEYDCQYPA
jgi:hypothetical protein